MSWDNTYENSTGSSQELRIQSILDEQNNRQLAMSRPLEFLFEDLLNKELRVSLILGLPVESYEMARDHAKACLITSVHCRKMYQHSLTNWLQSFILCMHPILRYYIEELLSEDIIKAPYNGKKFGPDRRMFYHLEFMHSEIDYRRTIGTMMNKIYENLNSNKHRLKQDMDGKVRIKKLPYGTLQKESIEYARKGIDSLDNAFYMDVVECRN